MLSLTTKLESLEIQINDYQAKIMELENQKESLVTATSEIDNFVETLSTFDDEIKILAVGEILERLGINNFSVINYEPDKPDQVSGDVEEIKILSQKVIASPMANETVTEILPTGAVVKEIPKSPITEIQEKYDSEIVGEIKNLLVSLKWDREMGVKFLIDTYGVESYLELTLDNKKEFLDYLKGLSGKSTDLKEIQGNYDLANLGLTFNFDDLITGANPDHGVSFNLDPDHLRLLVHGKFKNEITEIFKLLFDFADSENLTSVASDNICEKTEDKLKYNQLLFLSESDFPKVWEFLKIHWLDSKKKQEQELEIPITSNANHDTNKQSIFDDKTDYDLIDDLLHLLKDKFSEIDGRKKFLNENYQVGSVQLLSRDQLIDAIGKLTLEHIDFQK